MYIKCHHCGEVCETEFEPEIGQHLICPYCGEKFAYCEQKHEYESPDAPTKHEKSCRQGLTNNGNDIVNQWWEIIWLMGTVLLSILFVSELIEVIEASSGCKFGSGLLGKIWLFFVIRWACRVLFVSCIFMIGKRTVKQGGER